MEQVLLDYLKLLDIPVSKKYFRKSVASHPEYPSMLSVADTLERLGIEHLMARVQKEDLENLSFPFVLHLKRGQGQLLLIRNQQELEEHRSDLDDWNGVILYAEESEITLDQEHQEVLSREKTVKTGLVLLELSAVLFFGMMLFQHFTWYYLLLLATTIGGTVLGILLTAKDVGIRYEVVESFCNAGQNINCDRVLSSDEATLFGRFKLSDAVLSYFTFQLIVAGLWLPLANDASTILSVLFVFTMLSIPVVGYSIWLQGIKFKTWCRLCLLVAGVLVVQAGLFGWIYAMGAIGFGDTSLLAVGLVLSLFPLTGALMFLVKTRLEEGSRANQAMVSLSRVKYNPGVFTYLLLQEVWADCTPFEQELLIGMPGAPVKITMAASLGCAPCKEGFEKAVKLVEQWPEQVNLSVRFLMQKTENGDEDNHPGKTLFNGWLHHVYGREKQPEKTAELIKDWYTSLHQGMFRERYPIEPMNGKDKIIRNLIYLHTDWFKREGINKTPTFFLNGYTLPVHYRIEDVKMLFPGLPEQLLSDIKRAQKQADSSTERVKQFT